MHGEMETGGEEAREAQQMQDKIWPLSQQEAKKEGKSVTNTDLPENFSRTNTRQYAAVQR